MSGVRIDVRGGAADGVTVLAADADVRAGLPETIELAGEQYVLGFETDAELEFALVYASPDLPREAIFKRRKRQTWHRPRISAVKPGYLSLVRLGAGLVEAAELVGVPYPLLLEERKDDAAFDAACIAARKARRG